MNTFIAIDFETAYYAPESAISVGLVKYRDYEPVDSWYSLIRPPKLYVRPDFTDIHGLTVEDVRDEPDFKHIWNDVKNFIGDTPLVAHNASFDMKVLNSVLAHYEIPAPDLRYFCSLQLSRHVFPKLQSHALTALAAEHNIVYEAHNALADADTCARIVSLCAKDVFKNRKEILGVADLLKHTSQRMKRLSEAPGGCDRVLL
jgi:DNA polymerase-3 subunit epsilon